MQAGVALEIEVGLAGLGLGFLGGRLGYGQRRPGDRQVLLGDGQCIFPADRVDLEQGGLAGDHGVAFIHP